MPRERVASYALHIRVLLVHHHPIVRQGLRSILHREVDLEITGEASSGLEAVQLATYRMPDVAVIDLQLANPSGLQTAKAIQALCSKVRIVFVSLVTAEEYIEAVARIGACGFVVYERAQWELVRMIRSAA